jgi:hypothetical protein
VRIQQQVQVERPERQAGGQGCWVCMAIIGVVEVAVDILCDGEGKGE